MVLSESEARMRYPIHAMLLVGVSWLFYGVVLIVSSLLILPCVPLAPALVMLMIALGGLLSSVHSYARSVATPTQTATLRALAQATQATQVTEDAAQGAARAPQHG